MKTLLRIVIILTVALAVTGALYAVGQTEWATARLASNRPAMAEGAEGGRPMPDVSGAATTLGVTTEALTAAIGSFPPDYEQAAATRRSACPPPMCRPQWKPASARCGANAVKPASRAVRSTSPA